MTQPFGLDLSQVPDVPQWDLDARDLTGTELRARKKFQRLKHKKRMQEAVLTTREFESYVETFFAAGFVQAEAIWLAQEAISPESEVGMELIEKRKARIKLYVNRGYSREEAMARCAQDLIRHNKKRGNRSDVVISEALVLG